MYSIEKIKEVLQGKGNLVNPASVIKHLSVDSRRISFPDTTVFFALETSKRSGNEFITDAYNKGVSNFIVNKGTTITIDLSSVNIIYVEHTLFALQKLAAYHRSQFKYPVIAITGSNGKTIVKEWLYQLLSPFKKIVRSPKSFNSQIGVPLSVWEMSEENDLAIFEAGISQPGEMVHLQKIIQPTIGIFTNIGNAHEEKFTGIQQKAEEKAILFKDSPVIIVPSAQNEIVNAFPNKDSLFKWGEFPGDEVRILNLETHNFSTTIQIIRNNNKYSFSIPFADKVYVYNAIICIAVLLELKVETDIIQRGLSGLRPVDMRMQLMNGKNDCILINDSYSFDINAFSLALDFLMQQKQQGRKSIVISDLPVFKEEHYQELYEMIKLKPIYRVFTIGEIWYERKKNNKLSNNWFPYKNLSAFLKSINKIHFSNEVILLKGARVFGFEKIVASLQAKSHTTRLEINLSAITHNLNFYRSKLSKDVKLMAMVKAFAYGSGSAQIASLLQFHKVDYLAVAYADEGVELRKSGIQLPILVLNSNEDVFDLLLQFQLEPELFSFSILKKFASFLQMKKVEEFPVHLKLDTGMHRLGFEANEMIELAEVLKANPQLKIKSVFSHFAASDDLLEKPFTEMQASVFEYCSEILESNLNYTFLKHLANSAAITADPNFHYDMVRLGIGLYGIETTKIVQKSLLPAISLKTTIAQIRKVKSGDTIGYNRKGKVNRDSTIATIRIGYADGFNRKMSNGIGKVFIKGKLAPVIGIISMDMAMIDVTEIPDLAEEDEVEIFGENISVQQVAIWSETIPYEILTGISQRVKRVYIEE